MSTTLSMNDDDDDDDGDWDGMMMMMMMIRAAYVNTISLEIQLEDLSAE